MAIDFTIAMTVDRPPDEVFAVLSDPARLPEWQPLVVDVEVLGGGASLEQGARVREVRRVGRRRLEQVVEVSAFLPPSRLGLRILEGPVPIHGDIVLVPTGDGGTELRLRAFGRAPRALRVLEPVLPVILKRQLRSQYANLKRVVEASARPAAPAAR